MRKPDLEPLKNGFSPRRPGFVARLHDRCEQPESLLGEFFDHSRYEMRQDVRDWWILMANAGSDLGKRGVPLGGV